MYECLQMCAHLFLPCLLHTRRMLMLDQLADIRPELLDLTRNPCGTLATCQYFVLEIAQLLAHQSLMMRDDRLAQFLCHPFLPLPLAHEITRHPLHLCQQIVPVCLIA